MGRIGDGIEAWRLGNFKKMKTKVYQNVHSSDNIQRRVRIIFDMDVTNSREMPLTLTWHEQLELLFFREGGAAVFIGTARFVAQKGDVFVINALEPHFVKYHNGYSLYDCVMVERAVYHDLIRDICLIQYGSPMSEQNVYFRNVFHNNDKLAFLLDAIVTESKNKKTAHDILIERYAQILIAELFRAGPVEFKPIKDDEWTILNYQRMDPVLKYLDENYTSQISLDNLAAMCAISKYYFCRLFKIATGQTVIEYANSLRLSLANRLLHSTSLPITEIAKQAGFDDYCYFSRRYRKEFGVSPNKIR